MSEFILFLIVGFLAQAVDGALGMAYGVISATVLVSFGLPPAQASASVHVARDRCLSASRQATTKHVAVKKTALAGMFPTVIGALRLSG